MAYPYRARPQSNFNQRRPRPERPSAKPYDYVLAGNGELRKKVQKSFDPGSTTIVKLEPRAVREVDPWVRDTVAAIKRRVNARRFGMGS